MQTLSKPFTLLLVLLGLLVSLAAPAPSLASMTNTRGDTWGATELAGSDWLGGQGVNVYSNGASITYTPDKPNNYVTNSTGVSTLSGEKWQCVELVNRLYLTRGWISSTWYGSGNTLKDHLPTGLTFEANGSITYLNPGDVITLNDGGYGHAAIVNSVSGTSVQIVNQNTPSVYSSATFTNKSLDMSGWDEYRVQGVVHAPVSSSDSSSNSTDSFMVINSGGAAFANNVLNAGLTWQYIDNGDALKVAVGGNYMGLINGCGALFGKNKLSDVGWTQMTACGDARDVAVGSDGNYVIINGCGGAFSRRSTGSLGMDGWVQLTGCGDARAVSAGGKNIALINSGGTAYAAVNWWGPLQRVSNYGDARAIAVSSGGMLMMINGCGGAFANNGFMNGGWSQKAGCGDAVRIAVGGSRLVLINSGGTAFATDQWNGGMAQISNPGDAREVSVGDKGTVLMISGCRAAVANNAISRDGWYGLTGCGDALAAAG
jgi:hypothetical protein